MCCNNKPELRCRPEHLRPTHLIIVKEGHQGQGCKWKGPKLRSLKAKDESGVGGSEAVLKAHFSQEQCCVTMLQAGSFASGPGVGLEVYCHQAEIMKLSNLLKEYSSKLRIKAPNEAWALAFSCLRV